MSEDNDNDNEFDFNDEELRECVKIYDKLPLSDLIMLLLPDLFDKELENNEIKTLSKELDQTNEIHSTLIDKILIELNKQNLDTPRTYVLQLYKRSGGFYFVPTSDKKTKNGKTKKLDLVLPKFLIGNDQIEDESFNGVLFFRISMYKD